MEATISKVEHDEAMAEKDGQIATLRHELDQLKRLIFASKSERFVPSFTPEQMSLWNEEEQADAVPVAYLTSPLCLKQLNAIQQSDDVPVK